MCLAGCGSNDSRLDALHGATYWRQVGQETRHVEDGLYGYAIATNDSGKRLTITAVELTDDRGIQLEDLYLIVLRRSDRVDSFGGWRYPPRFSARTADLAGMWARRVPALGATIPAGDHLRMNFVLHLTGRPGARSGPLRITYQDADGNVGTWTSNIRYGIFQAH